MPVSDVYVVERATGEWVVSKRMRTLARYETCMALWPSHGRWHTAGVWGWLFSSRMAAAAATPAHR
jgi:hypothetical protein